MRRFSAILLLVAFTWAQYAKQAIYLECRVANTFKSFAVTCDCEKKAGLDKSDPQNSPLSKTHTHTHLDELFPVPKENTPDFSLHSGLTQLKQPENEDDCEGSYNKPFQPPRS